MRMDKLTHSLQAALGEAQSLAIGRDHPFIEPLHLLKSMLDSAGSASGSKASGFLSDRRSSDKRGSTTSSRTRKTTSRGTSPRSEHQNGSRQKILFYGSVGLVVVVIVAVVAVVTAPKPSACVIGDYYGKRLNQTSELVNLLQKRRLIFLRVNYWKAFFSQRLSIQQAFFLENHLSFLN